VNVVFIRVDSRSFAATSSTLRLLCFNQEEVMPSDARVGAGRRNGRLARGKKSEEGRQKCALNSTKHSLFAKTVSLSNEDRIEFEEMRKSYYDLWQPENHFESHQVDQMIAANWRIQRLWSVEAETIDLCQARMANSGELTKEFEDIPESTRVAIAFEKETNGKNTLNSLSRYETKFSRQILRAAKFLQDHRKNRILQNESNDLAA
jgi:hypothetical protein